MMHHLTDEIAAELKTFADTLDREGRLLSRARLDSCYDTFRQRFGPDVLSRLDGEELLKTLHGGSASDGLDYWLEFKNDDEFPTTRFGSIAGGSAFKFGLFFHQERQAWMTGSPQKPEELTLAEAIVAARRQRDELLAGANFLRDFAPSTEDADYRNLQQALEKLAPTVQDSAWGHKYFSLLFPDILDDYHSPDYARFHLIKLLQLPPEEVGRYVAGGRFVIMMQQINFPINSITTILNERDGRKPYRYWRIGTRGGDTGPSFWEMMQAENCVAIGWAEIGDLTPLLEISDNNERKNRVKDLVRTECGSWYKYKESVIGNQAAQINAFVSAILVNDIVVAMDGASVLGIGKVTGPYAYVANSGFPHLLPVNWFSHERWLLNPPEQLRSTVRPLGKYPQHLVEIERRIYGKEPIVGKPKSGASSPQGTQSTNPPKLDKTSAQIDAILTRKKQVILYGPPGTGKTYWAEKTARELAARSWFKRSVAELSESEQATVDAHAVRMCTFHPAYGYEDFLEGYRPDIGGGEMIFLRRDGVFKRLCYEAEDAHDRDFYLIIDEINRGDIPRIFGELLTVMEADKRGKSVLLPLSGTPFRVPPNVYVIGTMNTADRSIALLDTALRRRFGFLELMPDSSLFKNIVLHGVPLRPWLDALNQSIVDHIGRDGRSLQVGHSYFLTAGGKPIADFALFAQVLAEDIIPLLQEYCYEDYAVLEAILGPSLIDVKRQKVRTELFEQDRADDLATALLAPFPGIAASLPLAALAEEAIALDEEYDSADGEQ